MAERIYILAPYPIGEAPSQRFRFEQYISLLETDGYLVEFHPFLDKKTWRSLYDHGATLKKISGILRAFLKRFALLFKLRKADHIFIHREASHIGPPIFEWLIAKVLRKGYIYDFDDAIWLPNYSEQNARYHRLKAYWKVSYCIKWAKHVSAGNHYLETYAGQFNKNITVIPTTIDTENHHNTTHAHDDDEVVIGWTGTHTTMRYLDPLIPILQELEQDHAFKFIVISNEAPTYNLKSLEYIKWNKATEIEDLERLHIGVMPLEHDIWSEGKCGFKGLQYMALGIPSVLSPVGVNTTIVQHGKNGYLATTREEWYSTIKQLMEDQALRRRIGKAGQETVENHYSVHANSNRYLSLFRL
jgi:glycosyltransferase involved in cell wall biosynthesis